MIRYTLMREKTKVLNAKRAYHTNRHSVPKFIASADNLRYVFSTGDAFLEHILRVSGWRLPLPLTFLTVHRCASPRVDVDDRFY